MIEQKLPKALKYKDILEYEEILKRYGQISNLDIILANMDPVEIIGDKFFYKKEGLEKIAKQKTTHKTKMSLEDTCNEKRTLKRRLIITKDGIYMRLLPMSKIRDVPRSTLRARAIRYKVKKIGNYYLVCDDLIKGRPPKEQVKQVKRTNVKKLVTKNGTYMKLPLVSRIYGIPKNTLKTRIRRHDIEKIEGGLYLVCYNLIRGAKGKSQKTKKRYIPLP